VDFSKSAGKTVLNEIVCRDRIEHDGERVTPQTWNQAFDLSVDTFVDGILSWRTRLRSREAIAVEMLGVRVRSVEIYHRESPGDALP
jgi:hypothetical protein